MLTADEMLTAFSAVGLAVPHDPSWSDPSGLGVYLGSVPA
jgi:hypothetical protein